MGVRLRQLRLKQKLSLAEVSSAVGISVGFLSAIERSHMSASVVKLRKLARYYKLNILDFFDAALANPHRVRPSERKRLHVGPGVQMDLLAWGNTVMEPHLFTIAPGSGSGDSYEHEGEEFLYVLRGVLNIALGEQWYLLHPGDSFYFDSDTPHTWRNTGKTETVVLWVNTPPTF
jgi:quercetin dioxygenase-like cupin family protein